MQGLNHRERIVSGVSASYTALCERTSVSIFPPEMEKPLGLPERRNEFQKPYFRM